MLGFVFLTSLVGCLCFLHLAISPMTAERYQTWCNNEPECYPEWMFLIFAVVLGPIALFVGIWLALDLLARVCRRFSCSG